MQPNTSPQPQNPTTSGPFNFAPIQTAQPSSTPILSSPQVQTPQTNTQLDPTVVNLAKAIRQVESRNNSSAVGKSGEYGSYQFTPDTWQKWSRQYLGQDIPLNQSTQQQQNEVAYKKISELKNQGLNVGQIASIWNSGKTDPTGNVGTNKFGAKYDTPSYVDSVSKTYQAYKTGQTPPTEQTSSTVNQQPQQGFLGTNPNDSLYGKLIDNSVTRGIQSFFPGSKLGTIVGSTANNVIQGTENLFQGKDFFENNQSDFGGVTPIQALADTAQGALMAGTMGATPASSVTGRIVVGALTGAGFAGLGDISKGDTDVGNIAKQTAYGGILGGVLTGATEAVSALINKLPVRLTRQFLPGINEDTAKYAVNQGLGSPQKMLAESNASKDALGNQLGAILSDPKYANTSITGDDIFPSVMDQFPNSSLNAEKIGDNLKSIAPNDDKLIDRLTGVYTKDAQVQLDGDISNNLDMYDKYINSGDMDPSAVYKDVQNKIFQPSISQHIVGDAQQALTKAGYPEIAQELGTQLSNQTDLNPSVIRDTIQSIIDEKNSLSLDEIHTLNSDMGKNIYKTVFDNPVVKANKDIGNSVYQAISSKIQDIAPETTPIFDDLSKEYPLNTALQKAIQRGQKAKSFTLFDLAAILGGSPGGVSGSLTALGVEKALRSPTVNLTAGGILNKLGPVVEGSKAFIPPAIKLGTGLMGQYQK